MNREEPQITQIAAYFADRLPTGNLPKDRAVEAWRRLMRKRRAEGTIANLMDAAARHAPEDETLKETCDTVTR